MKRWGVFVVVGLMIGCGDGTFGGPTPAPTPGGGRPSLPPPPTASPDVFMLDLGMVKNETGIPGPPIVSHNALIVFPVDFVGGIRVVDTLGPTTAFEVQSKSVCDAPFASDLNWNIRRSQPGGDMVPAGAGFLVKSVTVTMPFHVPSDDHPRVAQGLCLVGRAAGTADFQLLTPRLTADQDPVAQVGSATFFVDTALAGMRFDVLGVLMEEPAAVSRVAVATAP